jgi:hypothetical protein
MIGNSASHGVGSNGTGLINFCSTPLLAFHDASGRSCDYLHILRYSLTSCLLYLLLHRPRNSYECLGIPLHSCHGSWGIDDNLHSTLQLFSLYSLVVDLHELF